MGVLYPIFVLVALTLAVTVRLAMMRWRAATRGQVNVAYYVTYQGGEEPPELRVVSRHLSNLLEMPLLFYTGCVLAYVTGQNGWLMVALAWLYVALRLVHSAVHLGRNVVLWRFRVFAASMLVLTCFWLALLAGLLTR